MTKRKKPYHPNNWKAYAETPAECFDSISFDEFMEWKIHGWELPSSIVCIVRQENLKTGKIKEKIYKRPWAAVKALDSAIKKDLLHRYTVVDEAQVQELIPKHLLKEDYDDPLA